MPSAVENKVFAVLFKLLIIICLRFNSPFSRNRTLIVKLVSKDWTADPTLSGCSSAQIITHLVYRLSSPNFLFVRSLFSSFLFVLSYVLPKDVLAVIENGDKESWLVGAPTTFQHVQKMTRWKKYNRFTWKNWFGQPIVGLHWTHSTVHWISHSRERGRTFCKRKRGRQRERGNWTETQRVLERRSERQIVRLRGCVCERERHRET